MCNDEINLMNISHKMRQEQKGFGHVICEIKQDYNQLQIILKILYRKLSEKHIKTNIWRNTKDHIHRGSDIPSL